MTTEELQAKLLEARSGQHWLKQFSAEEIEHRQFVHEATSIINYKIAHKKVSPMGNIKSVTTSSEKLVADKKAGQLYKPMKEFDKLVLGKKSVKESVLDKANAILEREGREDDEHGGLDRPVKRDEFDRKTGKRNYMPPNSPYKGQWKPKPGTDQTDESVELEEGFKGSVIIHSPGHRLHGKTAKVFHHHEDGSVNAQLTNSQRKGDVTNLTLKPGQFKPVNESELDEGKFTVNAKTGVKLNPKTGEALPPKQKTMTSKQFVSHLFKSKPAVDHPKPSMSHIDSAIGDAYPDVDPYEHLAKKFPDLHKQDGKFGSKLMDHLDATVKKNSSKHKSFNHYVEDAHKDFEADAKYGK
jgi:hypothetical protein